MISHTTTHWQRLSTLLPSYSIIPLLLIFFMLSSSSLLFFFFFRHFFSSLLLSLPLVLLLLTIVEALVWTTFVCHDLIVVVYFRSEQHFRLSGMSVYYGCEQCPAVVFGIWYLCVAISRKFWHHHPLCRMPSHPHYRAFHHDLILLVAGKIKKILW
jgi:hypothetical protein